MSNAYQFEAPFSLAAAGSETSIPQAVMTRCYGKQTPIAPHSQRALLAAQKDAKLELKGKGKGKGEETDTSKSKPKKNKTKDTKKKGDSKSKPATGASGVHGPEDEPREAKPMTEYSKAKLRFMDEFLNSI